MTIFRGKGDEGESDRVEEVAGRVESYCPQALHSVLAGLCTWDSGLPDTMDSVPSLLYPRCFKLHKDCLIKVKHRFWRPLCLQPRVCSRVFLVAPDLTINPCMEN